MRGGVCVVVLAILTLATGATAQCSGFMGVLNDPSTPFNFSMPTYVPDWTICTWVLQSPRNYTLQLSSFNPNQAIMQYSADSISVYAGFNNTRAADLYYYGDGGVRYPNQNNIPSSTITLVIKLGPGRRSPGLSLQFYYSESFPPWQHCANGSTVIIPAGQPAQSFTYPGAAPFNPFVKYPDNWHCRFLVQASPGESPIIDGTNGWQLYMRKNDYITVTDVGADGRNTTYRLTTLSAGDCGMISGTGSVLVIDFVSTTGPWGSVNNAFGWQLPTRNVTYVPACTAAPQVIAGGSSGWVGYVSSTNTHPVAPYHHARPNTYCTWLVTVPANNVITFTGLSLQNVGQLGYGDTVKVYDGDSTDAPLLGVYTAFVSAFDALTTAGTNALIVFESDQYWQYDASDGSQPIYGFEFTVASFLKSDATSTLPYPPTLNGCGGTLVWPASNPPTISVGVVGDAVNSYPRNAYCEWILIGPINLYYSFTIQYTLSPADELAIYAENTTDFKYLTAIHGTSNGNSYSYNFMNNRLRVVFRTDGVRTGDGWGFSAQILLPANGIRPCVASGWYTGPPGALIYYPVSSVTTGQRLLPNLDCAFLINATDAVQLFSNVGYFGLTTADTFTIYDGPTSSAPVLFDTTVNGNPSSLPMVESTQGLVLIRLQTDDNWIIQHGTGFGITWFLKPKRFYAPDGVPQFLPPTRASFARFPETGVANTQLTPYSGTHETIFTVIGANAGQSTALCFTALQLAIGDYVTIYDGNDIHAPPVASYTANTPSPVSPGFTATSGNVTLRIMTFNGSKSINSDHYGLSVSFQTTQNEPVGTLPQDFCSNSIATIATVNDLAPYINCSVLVSSLTFQGNINFNVTFPKLRIMMSGASLLFSGSITIRNGLTINFPVLEQAFGDITLSSGVYKAFYAPALRYINCFSTVNVLPGDAPFPIVFPNLTAMTTLTVSGCTALTALSFPRLRYINTISFINNQVLTNVDMSNLTYIGTSMSFLTSPSIRAINLTSLDWTASSTISLTGLNFLDVSSLRYADTVISWNLPAVVSLDLPRLVSTSQITITGGIGTFSAPLWQQTFIGTSLLSFGVTTFELPSLVNTWGTPFGVNSFANLVSIRFPKLRCGSVTVGTCGVLTKWDMSNFTTGLITVSQTNSILTEVDLSNLVVGSITVNAGNSQLTRISLPRLRYAVQIRIASLDLGVLEVPVAERIDSLQVTTSRLTSLEFPMLKSVGPVAIASSVLLAEFTAPILRYGDGTFSLSDSSITTLSFPSMVSTLGKVTLTSNKQLTQLYLCKLTRTGFGVTVVGDLSLSCFETRQMFSTNGVALTMTTADCNPTLIGSFGCSSNFTREVNVTGCGYTVACIQAAIFASYSNSSITVSVPPGTYTGCDVQLNFFGRSMVLQGSGEDETVIDCQGAGYAMTITSGETPDTIIRDMTFTNGRNTMNGGVGTIVGASPTFERVTFSQNTALQDGGAFWVSGGSPIFRDCSFVGNRAVNGGGLAVIGGGSPVFDNVVIQSNTATGSGGGLSYQSAASPVSLSGLSLLSNYASRGGGIYTDVTMNLYNVVIQRNGATQYGGAVASVPSALLGSSLFIRNSQLTLNSATNGGAIFSYSASVGLLESVIMSNTASDSGGGLSVSCSNTYRTLTGIVGPCPVVVDVTSSTLANNSVTNNGGAIASYFSLVSLDNATIAGNKASTGAGLYASTSNLTILSSTVVGNSAQATGGGLYCEARALCQLESSAFTENYAAAAGAAVYLCISSCPYDNGDVPTARPITSGLNILNNHVGRNGYGIEFASDPASLRWVVAPDASVVSGLPMTGAADESLRLSIIDTYGQIVSSGIDVLQLEVHDESGLVSDVSLVGPSTVLATQGNIIFVGTAAVASTIADTGLSYSLVCKHSTIAAVTISSPFTLLPCGEGQGIPAGAGDVLCTNCGVGTYASTATNFSCLPCAAGSIAASPKQSACALCPAKTYQPATGAGTCIDCSSNGDSMGATTCGTGAVLSNTVIGVVSGLVVALIVAAIVVAYCVYRYSRRRTMEKYYLDEDATIRRGVSESALALAIRKFITASTTTRIGGGEFTDVYKGRHENQWVALKVMKAEYVGHSIAQSEFRREVHALSVLSGSKHPAIVELRFFLERAPVCIGLEFLSGGSLKRLLPSMSLSTKDKVRMATQIASALAVMHNNNVVHMDLKTDNILVTEERNVKVADFGICRVLGASSSGSSPISSKDNINSGGSNGGGYNNANLNNTMLGGNSIQMSTIGGVVIENEEDMVAFTPQYCDSHRLMHEDDVSDATLKRADVFTLGMVMWALYKQDEPFAGIDPLVLIEQRKAKPTMRPPAVPDMHTCYAVVMQKAWNESPAARPTAMQCLDELRLCLTGDFEVRLPPAYYEVGNDPRPLSYAPNIVPLDDMASRAPPPPANSPPPASAYNSMLATSNPYMGTPDGGDSSAAMSIRKNSEPPAAYTRNTSNVSEHLYTTRGDTLPAGGPPPPPSSAALPPMPKPAMPGGHFGDNNDAALLATGRSNYFPTTLDSMNPNTGSSLPPRAVDEAVVPPGGLGHLATQRSRAPSGAPSAPESNYPSVLATRN